MNYLDYARDAVDLLAVYYIVYRLILLVKGTRAMQVIWGVLILAIISSLSKYAGLSATVWLLQQFWVAGIVMLIIIFQPEIRFALANLGSNPLGRLMSQEYKFIPELIEALRAASASRTGMLVVLEQDMGLRDIEETGVRINGEVSRELLLSVFHDNTPLHDGAAVIAGNRLVAAGCVLPLTEQQELSKILGMRHRAAIGLSEIADALIVAVSEETGRLSLARNGKLQESVEPDELEKMLYSLYRSREEKTLLRRTARKPGGGE